MASSQAPSSRSGEITSPGNRVEQISDSDFEEELNGTAMLDNAEYLSRITPPLRDMLETGTSQVQDETLEAILPFLEGNPNDFDLNSQGIPKLQRKKHVAFLERALGYYPPQFAAMDAARPWLLYWTLQGLTALGEDVSQYQERVADNFSAAQHPMGGYGGGHGQLPHLAATYAAVLSLVIVGGTEAYDSINRKSMWQYLGQMKQLDGGFTMSPGGEEDIRGAFCAVVILSLLNLPLDLPPDSPARAHGLSSFMDNLGDWVSRCQTFEGGISAAPGNEAHGAYAFCGLGCLSVMGPPQETLNKYLDMPLLIHWLSSRQCSPEGGYNGRTNKLVDGCYSHWVGSCWALVEAAAGKKGLWNRNALGRYILSAAQFKKGGLLDKPGKRPDAYHTCYNLAGLSAVQRIYIFDEGRQRGVGNGDLVAPFHWKEDGLYDGDKVWDNDDVVDRVHPVFVVPWGKAEDCRLYFERKECL
ncbi:terpenoid cyclases/Protein prenyltransferase [Lindgomyces ingoldianus]|uniref:Terpenoid cyclases/Protein prenyltransferase n=1 Tax=Lindgomyces ingoldianus TaxID=673940 RepID=A0ACB6QGE5_9PLEO|nr:terpenoid cyclases/Protein prenyltransferase [Lindgomyces ingoldianus]KAF2465432.1 terpenoid cyclases/Protein prenyltransferase [Lindgomyces ingoldianus]